MKKILLVLISALILIFVFGVIIGIKLGQPLKNVKTGAVTIKNQTIQAEIADSPALRYKGLSDRKNLCPECGMLFVFEENEKNEQTFVMRDMKFGLDIIWIKDDKILKIDKNLPPEGNRPKNLYSSGEPIDYVLEVNAGFADKNNINAGDIVTIFK